MRRLPNGLRKVRIRASRKERAVNAIDVTQEVAKAAKTFVGNSQEYCFLFVDWWPFCMTKSEWSGWMQAIAVTITLFLPFFVKRISRLSKRRILNGRYSRYEKSITSASIYIRESTLTSGRKIDRSESLKMFSKSISHLVDTSDHIKKIASAFGDYYYDQVVEFFRIATMADGDAKAFLGITSQNPATAVIKDGLTPDQKNIVQDSALSLYVELLEKKMEIIKKIPF